MFKGRNRPNVQAANSPEISTRRILVCEMLVKAWRQLRGGLALSFVSRNVSNRPLQKSDGSPSLRAVRTNATSTEILGDLTGTSEDTGVCEKNTPLKKNTIRQISFRSTKSGAG